jgi:hypothetical protein
MKLLFEEFFEKVFKLSESGSWHLRILIKSVNILIVVGIVFFIIYTFITKRYFLLLLFLGLVIIAESAHFIRKSRERSIKGEIVERGVNNNLVEPMDTKNDVLITPEKSKNKGLLKIGKKKVLLRDVKDKGKVKFRE